MFIMRKISALGCALILTFSTLAGSQGASEEYQAHCRDLQERMAAAKTRMVEGVLPQEDPSRFLSTMSCLDSILRMQFRFGTFFSMDALMSRFMAFITNRICGQASGQWNRSISWVNSFVGVNVELPWGVRATTPVTPNTWGPPGVQQLMSECTPEDISAARQREMSPGAYPRDWVESFQRMNTPPYWVAGGRGLDPTTGDELYPRYSYTRVRGYQEHGDIFSVRVNTLSGSSMINFVSGEIPGTQQGLQVAHWISECPRGKPVDRTPAGTPTKCIEYGTGVYATLNAFVGGIAGRASGATCELAPGKVYYSNFSFLAPDGRFRQPSTAPRPNAQGIVVWPTSVFLEWRIWACDASGCNTSQAPPGDGKRG